ncbi:hypothetical protein F2P81_013813 [Scophthalmus maximus]|uniref:Uncharacterized protein n=1 Tax=Scophthalmus maximus TaxID=52904 RepID=A0A6A4SKL4_SCOMX|nr:hypothetical protein F2P81_013813 [Scophthalmus maximus]
MDQINHIGRPCDSELRFRGTAQRFWTQRPSARIAGWLADAMLPLAFLGLTKQMAMARTAGGESAVNPKPPSIQRQVMREIRVDGNDRQWYSRIDKTSPPHKRLSCLLDGGKRNKRRRRLIEKEIKQEWTSDEHSVRGESSGT